MSWQPPPPPPRPGMPGGQPGGGQPGGGQPGGGQPGGQPGGAAKPINYYDLLQVNRDAHSTIIRYAYRFLAAMYHPDNTETGDAEKFRIITDAWRTLSDEGKRAAYDMSLGAREQSPAPGSPQGAAPGAPGSAGGAATFNRQALKVQTSTTWNELEMRIAMLQILLQAKKKRPATGGASAKMMMDILGTEDMAEMEFNIWYLREKGLIEMGERLFMISVKGVDYLLEQLSKTQILDGGTDTEKKMRKANINQSATGGTPNLPART
ncbi:MAG: J domain-containing protein [Candidatus Melainabacteria bacterium]|nr:J domain-containing protein [Candidatus Melainabacteria bacterium]